MVRLIPLTLSLFVLCPDDAGTIHYKDGFLTSYAFVSRGRLKWFFPDFLRISVSIIMLGELLCLTTIHRQVEQQEGEELCFVLLSANLAAGDLSSIYSAMLLRFFVLLRDICTATKVLFFADIFHPIYDFAV